jgi:hypothetical protein
MLNAIKLETRHHFVRVFQDESKAVIYRVVAGIAFTASSPFSFT